MLSLSPLKDRHYIEIREWLRLKSIAIEKCNIETVEVLEVGVPR